jgi:hypothetical protein
LSACGGSGAPDFSHAGAFLSATLPAFRAGQGDAAGFGLAGAAFTTVAGGAASTTVAGGAGIAGSVALR